MSGDPKAAKEPEGYREELRAFVRTVKPSFGKVPAEDWRDRLECYCRQAEELGRVNTVVDTAFLRSALSALSSNEEPSNVG